MENLDYNKGCQVNHSFYTGVYCNKELITILGVVQLVSDFGLIDFFSCFVIPANNGKLLLSNLCFFAS